MTGKRQRRFREKAVEEPYKNEAQDLLSLFMKELGKIPLLTREGEVELARTIERGGKEAEEAKKMFIESNLRLVIFIAKNFFHKRGDLSLEDIVQEGILGLARAVEKFDYKKGNRFSTYAANWIKSFITGAICDKSRTIRIPTHLWGKISALSKERDKIMREHNREPTVEELAEALKFKEDVVRDLMANCFHLFYGFDDLPTGQEEINFGVMSEELAYRERLLAGEKQDKSDAEDCVILNDDLSLIFGIMKELPEREQEILKMRFGLGDDNPLMLREVGNKFGLTRERVRQLQEIALQKIRDRLMEEKRKECLKREMIKWQK